jgi:hypothetical protein
VSSQRDSDDPDTELFETNATVLDDGTSGPKLCLGGIQESLPPQCGDVPITNWDWSDVDDEERSRGVTWGGSYHVVGRFDGDKFSLTEPPGPPAEHLEPADDFSSEPACEEPDIGWVTEGQVDQQAAGRALSSVRNEDDYAAGWVTQLEPPGEYEDTGPVVLNAAFTGDLERHEADLRQRWEGSLCVVLYERSLEDLESMRNEVYGLLENMSALMLYSDLDEIDGSINVHVIYLEQADREELEERYGDALDVTTALVPVRAET